MHQNKSIKKNYVYNLIYQVLIIVLPLITMPYLSRVLNADGMGRVSFVESIASYFIIFASLGTGLYGQREISYYQDDIDSRSEAFWNVVTFRIISTVIVTLMYLSLSLYIFKDNIYYLLILNILSGMFDITWLYQGMEEFGKIVFRNIFFKILSVAFIFSFVNRDNGVIVYALSIGLFTMLGNISLWLHLNKYIKKPNFSKINPFKDLRVCFNLFVPTIAIQVYTVLDKTMIGLITKSNFENGYYDFAMKISKILLTVITSLGVTIIPRSGFLFNKNSTDDLNKLIYKSYRFVCFIGIPMCVGLIIISNNLIPWFLGVQYGNVIPLLKILSLLIIIIGFSDVTGMQYLIPTKKEKIFTKSVMLGAITNFILNIILINKFYSVGAAIASVIAEFVVTFYQMYNVRNELKFKTIFYNSRNYIYSVLVMAIVLYLFVQRLTPSFKNSIIVSSAGVLIYFAMLLFLRDDFLIENINQIIKRSK